MSANYRKLYSYLVGQVDCALDLMDTGDVFQFHRVREILFNALQTAEEMYLEDAEETENKVIVLTGGKDT